MTLQGQVLIDGPAVQAMALALTAPISFWGGVDPKTSAVADPRHPEFGQRLAGRIVCVPATIGSSSASAILLELVHRRLAPAAIVLHQPDAILLLGLVVAKEMGYATPPALRLDVTQFTSLTGRLVTISPSGTIAV